MIDRVNTFSHSGNPTTAPTGVLPKTRAGDILILVVSSGGSNADPAIGGTSVTVGGLTWTKELSWAGIEGNPFNASLWWARASGDHSGQTVVASTVGSGSLVGAAYRGVLQSGDPFRFTGRHVDPIKEGNGVLWSWAWDSTSPPALKAGDLVLCGYCADDNPAPIAKPLAINRFVGEGKKPVWEEELKEDSVAEPTRYASSEGGEDTAAALWEEAIASDGGLIGVHLKVEPPTRGVTIVAALVPEPVSRSAKRARKPPLALDIEIDTPDGPFRLPSDSRKASRRSLIQPFSTQRGDGFTTGGVVLSRQIFKDYPDLNLMDTWRYVGRQGDVAYEGRHHSNPRTNDPVQQITVQLIGWAASYLKSYKIDPLVVDQRFASWQPGGLARRAVQLAEGRTLSHYRVSSDFEGLRFDGESGQSIPADAIAEVIYDAGPRNAIAKVMYKGTERNAKNVESATLWSDDSEAFSSGSASALTLDGTLRTATPAVAERFALLWARSVATHTPAAGSPFGRTLEQLAVYGDTGLETHALGTEPDCIYLSDIIEYILAAYYPKVKLAARRRSTFPVTQADWRDNKSYGYDIVQQLNNLVLWETNVWEDRTLYHEPADLTRYDWVIRTDDPGVTVRFQGASIEDFANGIEITYTDFGGVKGTLYPDEHAELRDDSEENPANCQGERLWIEKEIPWRCSEAEALQIGRANLAEYNRPKRPGSYRISGGYIKDAAGHWHQGWKVRNSQTLLIADHIGDEPRLITATNWDPQSASLDIAVDAPPKTLEAIVARQQLARQARSLS